METKGAIKRLAALAQESRLEVFRLLVKTGLGGLAAGEIARRLDTAPNTLSAQLLVLSNAGLVRSRREGRSILYAVDYEAVRDLMIFLTEDCCGGRAEICAPLAATASRCCKPSKRTKGVRHATPARAHRR